MNPYEKLFPANRMAARSCLQRKLHPSRFPQMPQALAAVVAFVLDTAYVQPTISEIAVTTDGAVFARVHHEPELGHYIAEYEDVVHGWFALLSAARLTNAERLLADGLFAERVGFYGQMQG